MLRVIRIRGIFKKFSSVLFAFLSTLINAAEHFVKLIDICTEHVDF